jgi:hypothetical protein
MLPANAHTLFEIALRTGIISIAWCWSEFESAAKRQKGSRPEDPVRSHAAIVAFKLGAECHDRARHLACRRRDCCHPMARSELFGGRAVGWESTLSKIHSGTAGLLIDDREVIEAHNGQRTRPKSMSAWMNSNARSGSTASPPTKTRGSRWMARFDRCGADDQRAQLR